MAPRKSEKEKADAKLLRAKKAGDKFIKISKEVHKDTNGSPIYDYSRSIYTKSADKVIIICKIHGEFLQSPNSHTQGHGCPKCGNDANREKQTMTQEEFIKRCNEKHPNLIDYSQTIYINFKTPIKFICNICRNEYLRDPAHMLGEERGHGCVICNGGIRDTLQTFIEKANKKHKNKYNYELVIYINSLTPVKIKCPEGHIFEQTPNHHISGDGCRKCHGHYRTQEEFIELSNMKFIDNPFIFTKLNFVNMGTLITLICPNNHEFIVSPGIHLRNDSKGGCKECAKIEASKRMSYTREEFINLANSKHNLLYLYDKVIYVNSQTEVIIKCKKHGEFQQLPVVHLMGGGCTKCGIERSVESKMLTEEDFIDKIEYCKRVHNNKYTYNTIYRDNGYLRIELICDKHGIFNQRLEHHIKGHGCYKCVVNYSKQQIEWLEYRQIRDGFIQHACNIGEYQIPETFMHADGFRGETNTIYEYQGDFWHGNPKIFRQIDVNPRTNTTYGILFEKTKNKIKMLLSKGYNVIEVWESEWDRGKKAIVNIQNLWRSARLKCPPV
jgi:hypothetical protein